MDRVFLVTGGAGFIGSHVAEALLERGDRAVVLDNVNDYYDPSRKRANLDEIERHSPNAGLLAVEGDIRDRELVARLFLEHDFAGVVHLAAMAGVRASIEDPALYFSVNTLGTLNLLEAVAGRSGGRKVSATFSFVLASTSSVYGDTEQIPFVESDPCARPLAPYAASKRAAEMLAFTYAHLYGLNVNVVRFFTVYGPRGRPDMMAYKVVDSICSGRSVPLYNGGEMWRDWTFVSDVVSGILAALDWQHGYEIFNLGRGEPVRLADFVSTIEKLTGRTANLVPAPMPDTDILSTHADTTRARQLLGYEPRVSVPAGVAEFLAWYERAVRPIS
jgi:UDP-glucuronate 4-epimerase